MIDIQPAAFEQKPLLRRMLELYAYDLSEYDHSDLSEAGEFGYNYLDAYWTETDRRPFLVRADGKPAGFAFVNRVVYSRKADRSLAEFFILKKYRRQGIGRRVAREFLGRFPGSWEIRAFAANLPAIRFWDAVLTDAETHTVQRIEPGATEWTGPIWILTSQDDAASPPRSRQPEPAPAKE